MGVITNNLDILGPWTWKSMGNEGWYPEGKSAMGEITDDGRILWAVVFDNYNPGGSIQMHLAIGDRKSVTRRAISAVFEYPFCQLCVKKVIAFVNSNNSAALTFDLRLGFEVETVIEDAYEMGNMYILSMTREQCRWIRGTQDGKQIRESSAAA